MEDEKERLNDKVQKAAAQAAGDPQMVYGLVQQPSGLLR